MIVEISKDNNNNLISTKVSNLPNNKMSRFGHGFDGIREYWLIAITKTVKRQLAHVMFGEFNALIFWVSAFGISKNEDFGNLLHMHLIVIVFRVNSFSLYPIFETIQSDM